MLILDTDVLTLIQHGGPAAERLQTRIAGSGRTPYVTVVTLEEQLRGRLAVCARATDPDRYATASRMLQATYDDYRGRNMLPFDDRAVIEFRRLKERKVRIGTMDLRIAAISLAHDATLITMNLRDFEQMPDLKVEDWTTA